MARDYAAEYRRRIERGQAAGKTRQEARGHREEIRAPGEESTYQTRQTRSIAAHLRLKYNRQALGSSKLSRTKSITLASQAVDRWGIVNTRKLLAMEEAAYVAWQNRDPDYPVIADAAGEYFDELNRRHVLAVEISRFAGSPGFLNDAGEWQEYHYIDFGDPPDYAIFLFYH